MKKLGFVLLSSALLLTACANNQSKPSNTSDSSKVTALSEDKQKMLDKATADYKTFVQEQIDKLLTDTEGFVKLLKEGKLEESKKVYPLIRMSYERSEPIAESFGESDVKIDFRFGRLYGRKTRQRKVGQVSTVSNVSFGKKIRLKELKAMAISWSMISRN